MIKHFLVCSIFTFTSLITYSTTPIDTLVIAWKIDELTSLDPAEAYEIAGVEYVNNTYDRLVNSNSLTSHNTNQGLAKSWKFINDGRTLQFILKKDLKFSSGNLITADDVVYSLQRVIYLNKSPASILSQFGLTPENVVNNIKAVDENTIHITFDKPYSPSLLLYSFSSSVASIVDKKLLKENSQIDDWGNNWLQKNYAGSGPFKLFSWKPNQFLLLNKNHFYPEHNFPINKIVIRHVPETTTQELLLQKGDVDLARNLNPSQIKILKGLKIESIPRSWLYYLGLNQKNKYLKIPEVQEAIKWLIDYKGISESVLKGQVIIHQSIVPIGIFSSIDNQPYYLDIKKAKSFLKMAGLEKGFSITMDASNPSDVAQILKENFLKANINLEIISGDSKQIITKYRARNHDIFMGTWSTDYPDPHANAGTFAFNPNNEDSSSIKTVAWRNSWFNPAINEKTLKALNTVNSEDRKQLYEIIQIEMQKHSPIICMFQKIENIVMRNNVTGLLVDKEIKYKNASKF